MSVDPAELLELAAVPAPTGAEHARAAWLERRLEGLAGTRERDAVGNVVWRFSAERPRLLVLSHLDTVFADPLPAPVRREGGELVGPGVGDNAAAVMALVWAAERLADPPAGLAIAFTVAEEGLGNLRGAREVCAALEPAAVVALEGHGIDEVVVDHVGSVRARVDVNGPGGHSWWDRGTPSATHALVEIAAELAAEGANVGSIGGGGPVNAIAAHADMLVELRSLEEPALDAFAARVETLSAEPPLQLEARILGRRGAGRTPPDHPLVAAVRALRTGLGLPDRLGSGSTDANAAVAMGIPAVAVGCARGSGMHSADERIDLRSLQFGCAQVYELIRALSG